jgi:hypothetical protein
VDDIGDDSIGSDEIIDNSVNTSDILNGSITNEKLADGAITIDKIADGLLTWNNIANKPYEIVAAGVIYDDGTIVNSYNVKSVFWNATAEQYEISIINENYHYLNYVTSVTPMTVGNDAIATTGSVSSKLIVRFYDASAGTRIQSTFHFIVYDFGWTF